MHHLHGVTTTVCSGSSLFTPIVDSYDHQFPNYDDSVTSYTLPFPFPWITGEGITSIGISTNGAINMPYRSTSYYIGPIAGSVPRIAVAQEDLNPGAGGSIYAKTAADGNSVTISWENVPFFPNSGFVNAQVTLHKTGDITFCYGSGNTAGNYISAGLSDNAFSLAFPMPLPGFDAQGRSALFPQNTCACLNNSWTVRTIWQL